MKTKLQNLKEAWQEYQNLTGTTQVAASKKLGWAPATLGLYLSGKRELRGEHMAQLSNLLLVDPHKITESPVSVTRELEVVATTSSNPAPQKTKKIAFRGHRQAIFCDIPLLIEGAALAIPAGATLLVDEVGQDTTDPKWPTMTTKYWAIVTPKKIRLVLSKDKPREKSGETVYQVTSALFV